MRHAVLENVVFDYNEKQNSLFTDQLCLIEVQF